VIDVGGGVERANRQEGNHLFMNESYYLCRRCGLLVESPHFPRAADCRAGGNHGWHNLGRVGKINIYRCLKCETQVTMNHTPGTVGCPAGGPHKWAIEEQAAM
jgi:DNA-directed RNA polymerase subunit RPC12/RpoP